MIPHSVQTIRAPNDSIVTWSGHASTGSTRLDGDSSSSLPPANARCAPACCRASSVGGIAVSGHSQTFTRAGPREPFGIDQRPGASDVAYENQVTPGLRFSSLESRSPQRPVGSPEALVGFRIFFPRAAIRLVWYETIENLYHCLTKASAPPGVVCDSPALGLCFEACQVSPSWIKPLGRVSGTDAPACRTQ
jgi:hypothetical protein